eukprot:2033651-Alexandrium_andersonii.AAC.1
MAAGPLSGASTIAGHELRSARLCEVARAAGHELGRLTSVGGGVPGPSPIIGRINCRASFGGHQRPARRNVRGDTPLSQGLPSLSRDGRC